MRRILKRFLTTDRTGRVLTGSSERLTDDGAGGLNLTTRRTALGCPGCRRMLEDLGEFRGRCDYCRSRGCCVHCETRCQACSRRLCWACRRGFPGPPTFTVCPVCLVRLRERQAVQDQLAMRQASFQRRMALQREWTRLQTLRLRAAQLRAMGNLAAIRERNRFKLALIQAWGRGRRS